MKIMLLNCMSNISSERLFLQFLVTFIIFPENHPAHKAYLEEHKCVGVLQPQTN